MIKHIPSLTIITSHFDDISGLIMTFKSLKNQTFKNWRWLIIDAYTKDFFLKIPSEIKNGKKIEIFQLYSSIYDAMNLGILNVETNYFHFLNCNSTYKDYETLEKILNIIFINSSTEKKIYTARLLIQNKSNKLFIQKPNKWFYPFKSGHESTIFPTMINNKLLIKSNLGIVADIVFLNDYEKFYKVHFLDLEFINYPKGGFSDSSKLINDKLNGYLKLLVILFLRIKLIPFTYCLYRIFSLLKEFIVK